MDIATDGASAPADTGLAPIEHVDAPPSALSDAPPPADAAPAEEAKPAPSARAAIEAAAAKVEASQKDADKPAALVRDEATGKFKPAAGKDPEAKPADQAKPGADQAKEAAAKVDLAKAEVGKVETAKPDPAKPAGDPPAPAADPSRKPSTAPARFSADAKAAWDAAPEPVKAEVARMERELTAGIEKHRARVEALKPFDDMAAKAGTTVEAALKNYTDLDMLMHQNPLNGLEAICERVGVSLRDVAQIVLGQTPDQERSAAEAQVRELKAEVNSLKQKLGGVTQRFEKQDHDAVLEHVTSFAKDKPLFDLLAPHIVAEMNAGVLDLEQAYEAALQKHPQLAALASPASPAASAAADPPAAASTAAAPDLEAQTRKGQKSVAGAPGTGSEPAAQPRSSSIREALRRAAARAG